MASHRLVPLRLFPHFVLLTQLFLAWGFAASVFAQGVAPQQRTFPPNTRWGQLSMGNFPQASIDGQAIRFAAGGRILNESNLSVTPMSVTQPVIVRYRVDFQGQIQDAWILNPAEIVTARREPRAGSAAQTLRSGELQ